MNRRIAKELYEKYAFLVYKRCLLILNDKDESKDAMQDIMLKLIDNFEVLSNKKGIISWIYTSSNNFCFNILRKKKKFNTEILIEELSNNKIFDSQIDAKKILNILLNIKDKNIRESAYYTYVEELKQSEIQKITGRSPATIRRDISKFKEHVEIIRKRYGI